MNNAKLACTLLGFAYATSASAMSVYSGCSVPTEKANHNTFYVDPVNGSMSGDGSAAKPWSTLAAVLDPANKLISTQAHGVGYPKGTDTALHPINPTAPIKAGDVILLRSGNHGSPTLSNMYNTDFITIAAAPNATPIVGATNINSASKWIFQGLTFEAMYSTKTGATSVQSNSAILVNVGQGSWMGPSQDIVFDSNTIRTAASTSGWTDYDWINKPYNAAFWVFAPCVAATNNHIYNVFQAALVQGQNTLIQGNTIEYFANDAMEIVTSNLLIKNNIIRNSTNSAKADLLHADGIQGFSLTVNGQELTNSNVVIDGNTLTKGGDPDISYMQGISIFDGKWNNLLIQNNVVDVNTWHGIAVFGGQNVRILNNTVISSYPSKYPSWLTVRDSTDGGNTTALVRNNAVTSLVIAGAGATYDHNIAALRIATPSTTVTTGTIGTANTVNPALLNGFMDFDTTSGVFDMRLRPTSVAVGAGIITGAPSLDIVGTARTSPVDIGAYVHQSGTTASTGKPTQVTPGPRKASLSP